MHRFTVDYAKDRSDPRVLLNRGFFVHETPRLMPVCRLLGHKPVVDGYDSTHGDERRARWVTCGRCGVRPQPQGWLDADQWSLGQSYTGLFLAAAPKRPSPTVVRQLARRGIKPSSLRQALPGPWPERPEGAVGAQLVIGRSRSFGLGFKVGNMGSEQPLAAHVSLGPLGALHVHTEGHGRAVQRLLNPTSYHSRVVDVSIHNGSLWWELWARRHEYSTRDPRWMHGNVKVDPRHYILGKHQFESVQHGPDTPGVVHMPDGTSHPVTLKLEKWTRGRVRGRKTSTWEVDWSSEKGIPIRNHAWKGDEVLGSSVAVTAASVENGQWPQEACAAIAIQCAKDRARYGYQAEPAA